MSDELRIAVVPGDGIGVEVTAEAVRVLEAVAAASGRTVRLTDFDWGADHYLKTGVTLPEGALHDAAGGLRRHPARRDGRSARARQPARRRHPARPALPPRPLRQLPAGALFHEKLCPLKGAPPKDVDFVVFRENTEGLYVMMGGNFKKDTPDEVATEIDLNTRKGVERIIRHAFEYARAHGPDEGRDGGQVERPHPRPRPLAARLQGGGRRVPGDRGHPSLRGQPRPADGARTRRSSR